jgi:hypothetical protein
MRRGALGRRLARITPQSAVGSALAGCGVLSLGAAWLHPTARHLPLAAGVLAVLLAAHSSPPAGPGGRPGTAGQSTGGVTLATPA